MAGSVFESIENEPDSFLGIGVRPQDLDMLPWKYKPIVVASELLKAIANRVSLVRWLSDSVYLRGRKAAASRPSLAPTCLRRSPRTTISGFCLGLTRQPLRYDHRTHSLLSPAAGLRFAIQDDVPVLIPEAAQRL